MALHLTAWLKWFLTVSDQSQVVQEKRKEDFFNLLSKDGAMKMRFRSGSFSQLGLAYRKPNSDTSPKVPMNEKTEMKAGG